MNLLIAIILIDGAIVAIGALAYGIVKLLRRLLPPLERRREW